MIRRPLLLVLTLFACAPQPAPVATTPAPPPEPPPAAAPPPPTFGFNSPTTVAPARILHLTRDEFHREWVPPTWTARPQRRNSYSPIMRARMEWSIPDRARGDVDVVAYDTTNDAVENYDLFLVEAGEREIVPDAHHWFALSAQTENGLYGSWSKILRADPTLNDVAIYWGAISRTEAWPESFRARLDSELGFWPGAADEQLDAETIAEQKNRLSDFLARAQLLGGSEPQR
jgi:hypothetical protein